jgi:hypothetical protein
VGDAKVRSAALADGKRIRDGFTAEQLTAGATILKATFAAFRTDAKKAYFARNGVTAWIAAYVAAKDTAARPQATPRPVPALGSGAAIPVPYYPAYPTYSSYFVPGPVVYYPHGVCGCYPVVPPPCGPAVYRSYAPSYGLLYRR